MQARYMSGFGNSFETEALPDALPIGRNSPQKCNYGLYAEQLSGSPFTAPQATNQRSWLYRIRPAVKHSGRYRKVDKRHLRTAPCREESDMPIGQMRWSPVPMPDEKISFVEGLCTVTTAGDADTQVGMAAHLLFVTRDMRDEYFFNADGELLIVAQENRLRFCTEFGVIEIEPGAQHIHRFGELGSRYLDARPVNALAVDQEDEARAFTGQDEDQRFVRAQKVLRGLDSEG